MTSLFRRRRFIGDDSTETMRIKQIDAAIGKETSLLRNNERRRDMGVGRMKRVQKNSFGVIRGKGRVEKEANNGLSQVLWEENA